MQYWQKVLDYFVSQGIPENVVRGVSIYPEDATRLVEIVEEKTPHKILEIGTFIGLSTGVLALASAPDSILVCVDPSLPVSIHSRKLGHEENTRTFVFVEKMLDHFGKREKTILLEGFCSYISPEHKNYVTLSGGNAEQITIIGDEIGEYSPYDLVFHDGDHSTENVYSDLLLISKYLSSNGIIIIHDVSINNHWRKHVLAGVEMFLAEYPDFSFKTENELGFLIRET